LLTKSSYVLTAKNIELESASSGSSRANLCAASMHAFLPTTGVGIPVYLPKSSSLSMQITSNLFAVVALTSFSSFPLSDIIYYITKLPFNDFPPFLL